MLKNRVATVTAVTIASLLTAGCYVDDGVGTARESIILNPQVVTISTLSTGVPGAYGSGSGVGQQFDLRPMGVALEPSGLVVVAAPGIGLQCVLYPYPICTSQERVSAYVLSIAGASPTVNPTVAASFPHAVLGNPAPLNGPLTGMRGMAATPFRDASGNVDGLFLLTVAGSPARVRAFAFEGEASSPTPSTSVNVAGTSSLLQHTVVPALSHGTWGTTNRIFMAYSAPATAGGVPKIRAGFLTRSGTNWTFSQTAEVVATSGVTGSIYHGLVAAHDANTHEFTVGWQFDELSHPDGRVWTAYLQRFSWAGVALGSRFVAHIGADSSHSGAQLAFNRDTDRYHFLFQHNSALVERTVSGLSCIGGEGACYNAQPCVVRGSRATTEVDYFSGWEFRMGGSCLGTCPSGQGIMTEMVLGSTPTALESYNGCSPDDFVPELFNSSTDVLWHPSVHPGGTEVVDIVRAPLVRRAVALLLQTPRADTGASPLLQFRVLDETGRAFDE